MKRKDKPLYNVWQNSVYVLSNAWKKDKIVIHTIVVQILLTVSMQILVILLPALVVANILVNVGVNVLVFTILKYTVGIVIIQSVLEYLNSVEKLRRTNLRMLAVRDNLFKSLSTDFANLGEQRFINARRKALDMSYNNQPIEQIYCVFKRLGINLLGFVVYVILLSTLNPLVMLIVASTTILGVFARNRANKWRHNHDDEATATSRRIWYVNDAGNDLNLAKDMHLFAMKDWLEEVYAKSMKLAYDFTRRLQTKHFIADMVDLLAAFVREGVAYAYLIFRVLFLDMPVDNFV